MTQVSESTDVTRRVRNGYGVATSLQSVTNIGICPFQPRIKVCDPPGVVSTETELQLAMLMHNPSRKSAFMQVSYPETIKLLQPVNKGARELSAPRRLRLASDDKPFAVEFPDLARRLVTECRQTEDSRKANSFKSRRCQIKF